MNKKRISEAINNLDESIVEEAVAYQNTGNQKLKRYASIAACAALIALTSMAYPFIKNSLNSNNVTIGGVERNYKKTVTVLENMAYIWPWEYQEIYVQYSTLNYNGKEYQLHTSNIDKAYVGESLGSVQAFGYDETDNDKEYRRSFEAFRVNTIRSDFLIAVNMEGKYILFKDSSYTTPPATLGEFINEFDLTKNIKLKYFENYTNYKGDINSNYYSTDNSNAIWEQLLKCADTPYLKTDVDLWLRGEREFTSFTITSDALGIYKKVMYVTSDGYLSTNVFGPEYIFYIGEEAAKNIIACTNKNAKATEREPYNYSLVGTVSEIGENYFLIDDSILCKNADKGMIFKVDATSISIRRYIDIGRIKVGDLISVDFHNKIDTENENLITDAYNINTSVNIEND